jgi:hypothetical protein
MDRKLHVDILILIPTLRIYVFWYSGQTDGQTHGRTHGQRHTLAVHGLEELFFQLCCCVSFFVVVVGNSYRCYLPTIPVVPLCLVAQVSFRFWQEIVLGITYLMTVPVVPMCQFFGFGRK